MTQITPEQALEAVERIADQLERVGDYRKDKPYIDDAREAIVTLKAALSQRVGVTEDELQKIISALKLVDDFVNKPAGFKGEMVYDDAAYKKFMADLEERETAMTKAIKEVLEKHGHLLNGLRIIKGA